MAHKRKPKLNKAINLLLEAEDNELISKSLFSAERENLIPSLDEDVKREVQQVIYNRWLSADDITREQSRKMYEMDRLYNGLFEQSPQREGQTFLNKTRENVKSVYAYLLQLVSQLDPIVTCLPKNFSTIHADGGEFRRSKVMEAMLNFQFETMWKFRDDVFPLWLKHFLKYSLAIYKIGYKEDNFKPDLYIEVVGRDMLHVDPYARDLKEAKWICETQFMSRSEVYEMVESKHWDISEEDICKLPSVEFTNAMSESRLSVRNRLLNAAHGANSTTIEQDDIIEIIHYYQAQGKGLDPVYSVIAGGIHGKLVRHGLNPFPYKGIPFRGKSFDPDEAGLDGTGLVEEFKPTQVLINNLFELRNRDIQNNVYSRKLVAEQIVGEQTHEDWEDGHQLVRMNKEFSEMIQNDPNFDARKYIIDLGVSTSTNELMGIDLPFILQQGKETSFISDVFRGQTGAASTPFATVRESLIRNQGAFRPIYLQVMRCITEISEIMVQYFQSPEFYPVDRVVYVVGKNRYADVVNGWHNPPGSNMFVRQITPDETDVDVTINAVSGADAIASKSITNNAIAEILQALGQIPGAFDKVQETKDISKLFDIMIENIGADIDQINLTPEEQALRKQQQEQTLMQQQQMLMQQQQQLAEIENQKAQFNAQLEMQKQAAIQQARAQAQVQIDGANHQMSLQQITVENDLDLKKIITKITTEVAQQLKADLVKMNREAILEARVQGVSVGHTNNISQ